MLRQDRESEKGGRLLRREMGLLDQIRHEVKIHRREPHQLQHVRGKDQPVGGRCERLLDRQPGHVGGRTFAHGPSVREQAEFRGLRAHKDHDQGDHDQPGDTEGNEPRLPPPERPDQVLVEGRQEETAGTDTEHHQRHGPAPVFVEPVRDGCLGRHEGGAGNGETAAEHHCVEHPEGLYRGIPDQGQAGDDRRAEHRLHHAEPGDQDPDHGTGEPVDDRPQGCGARYLGHAPAELLDHGLHEDRETVEAHPARVQDDEVQSAHHPPSVEAPGLGSPIGHSLYLRQPYV